MAGMLFLVLVINACSSSGGGSGDIIYVNTSASGISNGSSWIDAFTSLTDALTSASSNDEIWVAAGTYYPTTGTDRTESFTLVSDVSVYGGFAGTETSRDERDYTSHVTTLSGDIDQDGLRDGENSYHVVTGADEATLDGFTIEMGYAAVAGETPSDFLSLDGIITYEEKVEILRILEGVKYIAGAGMLNIQAAPTVKNCTFQNNYAAKGGAVYNMVARSFPATDTYDAAYFENCIFQNNYGTGRGGAVNNDMFTNPTFISCRFLDNECESKGGAVYSDMGCSATFVNVLFAHNTAERGSALVSDGSSTPSLLYVTMVNNNAADIGSALYQGTYGAEGQTDGQTSTSNDPKIMYSLVMGNTSDASGTSISNWLDCALNIDSNSVVETVDGTCDLSDYFASYGDGNYEPIGDYTSLGWSASRDTSGYETAITALTSRTYEGYPYDSSSTTGSGTTHYVDYTATDGTESGDSWHNAHLNLQTALTSSQNGDTVLVAAGTYYPSDSGDREAAFVLKEGVTVYGGYAADESGNRDVSAHVTILSGDIDKDSILDSGNSYHVIAGGKDALLDGVTVQHGYADGDWCHQRGAGMIIYGSSEEANNPTVNNCIFQDNYALEGGALACYNYGTPTITGCTFNDNQAVRGGAVLFRTGSDGVITGSTFSGNTSTDRGGAVFIDYGASPLFSGSCVFSSNSSTGYGGALYVDDNASQIGSTSPSISDCSFTGNSTDASYGGAIFAYNTVTFLTVTSCTFSLNTAAVEGKNIGLRYMVKVNFSVGDYSDVYEDGTITYDYSE